MKLQPRFVSLLFPATLFALLTGPRLFYRLLFAGNFPNLFRESR